MDVDYEFASALLRVKELHHRRVEYLANELERRSEESELQRERISHLENALARMKDSLTAYEREIEQLNEVISHLQAPALSSEAQTEPHPSPIPRENIFTPVRFHPAEVREQTDGKKTINKTCMSLFSDSPSLLHTPGSVTKLFTPKQHPTTLPVEDTPQRANHVGAEDVNDPLFHLTHAFSKHRHPVRGDHALVPAPEFLSDCEYLSNSSSASHSTAAESDGEPVAVEDQADKIQENIDSKTGMIARNPLSLKVGRKLRYTEHRDKRQSPPSTDAPKVDDKDHSTASSSAPNLDTSPPLSESPQPDFPPSVGSHCSDLASPSLLRQHPSGSPWKHTQSSSPVSHHPGGNLSQSLFVTTPAVPPEDESCDVVTTPLCVTTELQIPNTDSQLSLDISDTMPPSPELCFAVQEIPSSRPVLKGTDCEVVSPQPASGERETSVHCLQINSGFIERRNSTPREKEKRLIQSTLTKLKLDVEPTGRYESNAVADSHIGRTLVLATPGMKPVDRMLGRGSAWIHKRTQLPAASSKAKRTLNDISSDDGENVLPQKKPHLQLEIESNDRTKYCEPLQVEWSLDATRLLPDRDEQTQSKEAQTSAVVEAEESTGSWDGAKSSDQPIGDLQARKGQQAAKYKYVQPIRNRAARAKLNAKACPDCNDWYIGGDGIHGDRCEHLKTTCRHKHLHLPPDTDPKLWDIGFPATEETD